jgi:hypothetical protein
VMLFDRFSPDANADTILGYEKIQPGISEGLSILYGDGHVTFEPEAEALRLLKEAGQDVPDALPDGPRGGGLPDIFGGSSRRSAPVGPGEAWYYDTKTKEYFKDVTTKVAPFNNDKGNESVRAHFFTCGDCTDEVGENGASNKRFIGYYEKYTPEVKAKIEEKSDSFMIYEMAFQGRLYSKDGKKWVAADKPEGIAITSDLQKQCPPKKLRYCPPDP